jgi:hypothetical protein
MYTPYVITHLSYNNHYANRPTATTTTTAAAAAAAAVVVTAAVTVNPTPLRISPTLYQPPTPLKDNQPIYTLHTYTLKPANSTGKYP